MSSMVALGQPWPKFLRQASSVTRIGSIERDRSETEAVPQFPNAAAPPADLPLAVPGVSEQPGRGELLAALQRESALLSEDAGPEIVQCASTSP